MVIKHWLKDYYIKLFNNVAWSASFILAIVTIFAIVT